jgi:hypothetical protein
MILRPIAILVVVVLSTALAAVAEPSGITDLKCDAIHRCPPGLECYSFPGKGLRCASGSNPCALVNCGPGKQCVVAESYPAQLFCSDIIPPVGNDGDEDEVVEHSVGEPSTAPGYNPR